MSYQVLARKYRPQRFEEVVGQEHVTQTLQNALALKRIHHAYLFTGARGIGKTTVARILAKALNCEQGVTKEPCGKCSNCVEIVQGKSIDVQEIDGASNTGVDDVREIREQAKYLPAKGRYKVYIIDEVHMLSTSAFNALLKTLEEPPPHVIFVFATTEVHKIPSTILSRCQRYDFRRIPTTELVASLGKLATTEKVSFEEDALHLIAHEAQGSLRDAQSLMDQAIAFAGNTVRYDDLKKMFGFLDRAQLWQLLEAILNKDREAALNVLNDFYQSGSDLNRLAQDLLVSFRNLLLLRSLGKAPDWLDLPKEELSKLQTLASSASVEELDQLFTLTFRGVDEIARASFPKMVFEVLLVRMTLVTSIIPVKDILEKLEGMSHATPVSSPSPTKGWGDFQTWVQKTKPQVSSIVNHGELAKLDEKSVTLRFDKASVYGEMLQEPDRKGQIEELLRQFFGKSLALQVIFSETAAAARNADAHLQKKTLREEALKNDSIREATNILGAIVEEVHIDLDKT